MNFAADRERLLKKGESNFFVSRISFLFVETFLPRNLPEK